VDETTDELEERAGIVNCDLGEESSDGVRMFNNGFVRLLDFRGAKPDFYKNIPSAT